MPVKHQKTAFDPEWNVSQIMVANIAILFCLMLVALGAISFKLGSYLISRLDGDKGKYKKYLYEPEFIIGALYCTSTFFVIVPYYNKFYRWGVIFFGTLIFFTTVINFIFVFLPILIYRRRVKRAFLVFVFSVFIFFVQVFHEGWRYSVTDVYLRKYYCGREEYQGEILGGIIELRGGEYTEHAEAEVFNGAFENDAHCVSSIGCAEEFYYCTGE